jgi:hypothetical protein
VYLNPPLTSHHRPKRLIRRQGFPLFQTASSTLLIDALGTLVQVLAVGWGKQHEVGLGLAGDGTATAQGPGQGDTVTVKHRMLSQIVSR